MEFRFTVDFSSLSFLLSELCKSFHLSTVYSVIFLRKKKQNEKSPTIVNFQKREKIAFFVAALVRASVLHFCFPFKQRFYIIMYRKQKKKNMLLLLQVFAIQNIKFEPILNQTENGRQVRGEKSKVSLKGSLQTTFFFRVSAARRAGGGQFFYQRESKMT